jgi:hypothetical protein
LTATGALSFHPSGASAFHILPNIQGREGEFMKPQDSHSVSSNTVRYGAAVIDGLNIAYREAGDPQKPKLVLLHGFPALSHQYRNLK